MAKVKITNTINPGCARGVETPDGTVFIEPGETVEVDLLTERKDGSTIELYEGLEIADGSSKKVAPAKAKSEPEEKAD